MPTKELPKLMEILSPGQTVWSAIAFTSGVGFMVTTNVCDAPTHDATDGVTTIVLITSAPVLFAGAL